VSPPVIALLGLVVLGAGLRLMLTYAWNPGFFGFADTSVYLEAAGGKYRHTVGTVFFDTMRPAGYPIALRVLHGITTSLSAVMSAQHVLGLATAVLLFLTVRRTGISAWLALAPAATVLFVGAEVLVEHAALTESLYIFLQALALYAAVRSLDSMDPGWAALAGASIGAAADVRLLGLAVVPTIVLWIALARRDSIRGRLVHGGMALLFSAALIGGYVYAQRQATGFTGLTRAGAWNTYGRVAPFADCSKFTPPRGTGVLCEQRPPSQRPGLLAYLFGSSPAERAFGYPDYGGYKLSSIQDNKKIAAFAEAVIVHQPIDYAKAVGEDAVRYIDPNAYRRYGDGVNPSQFIAALQDPTYSQFVAQDIAPLYYDRFDYTVHGGLMSALESYERHTRIQGAVFIFLLLLAVLAPFIARPGIRRYAVLLTLAALELLLVPIMLDSYEARLGIPTFGVLASAAAVGAAALHPWLVRPVRLASG
jgi:hypothetical protein